MSWHKQFNIVDLGMLGSPIMAKLQNGHILADYFFDFAAPDIIESHYGWSCRYLNTIFKDNRFRERYSAIRETKDRFQGCDSIELPAGVWIRKDIQKNAKTTERILIDDLKKSLDVTRLDQEMTICQRIAGNDCIYIARTAYRFLPEFISAGSHEELKQIFRYSNTKTFDLYLINGFSNGQAHNNVIDYIAKKNVNGQIN